MTHNGNLLFNHIANTSTDLAQSLHEYKTELCREKMSGTTRISIDNETYKIDELIEKIDKFAQEARKIEHLFNTLKP